MIEIFGAMLQRFRRRKGYDKKTLAELAGIDRGRLAAWENGRAVPRSRVVLQTLGEKLGLSSSEEEALFKAWSYFRAQPDIPPPFDSSSHSEQQSRKIDERYLDSFFYYRNNFASSVRLFGAYDEFFPSSTIHMLPENTPYKLPRKLFLDRTEIIEDLEQQAAKRGVMFFDGPNTRLIDYRITPRDETEQKHLELRIGPVGWHDYSVCKWALEAVLEERTIDEVKNYIDLDEVAFSRSIKNNKLTNILCTATTIVTQDSYALYAVRGSQVAIAQKLTSCIAENIHQKFDHSLEMQLEGELPSPFRTVIRGVSEEASPKLAEYLQSQPQSIFLLSMDFELLSFQPDLLFMIILPFTYNEIRNICRQHPGRDFIEGSLQPISLADDLAVDMLLSNPNWIPSGKASLIRSIEFLSASMATNPKTKFEDLVEILRNKNK